MNAMLADEELTRLLEEAAGSFAVPDLALELRERPRRRLPRWPLAAAAAIALVTAGAVLVGSGAPPPPASKTVESRAMSAAPTVPTDGAMKSGLATARTAAGKDAPLSPDGARIVKTGTLSVQVDKGKVSATVTRLEALVAGVRGYVSSSSTDESGTSPTATMTVRVPVAAFEGLIGQVRALKLTVLSATSSGQDVTATYADTQAKIDSLKAARARYLTILGGARSIPDILTVQQRLDDVQQQIDQLEGQRRLLADQSDLATLTLSVAETGGDVFVQPSRSGWSKAWHDAVHGFTGGLQDLLAGSGTALLVLLVGIVLVLLGRRGWTYARRRLL